MVLAPSARDFLVRFLFFFISLARTIPGVAGTSGQDRCGCSFSVHGHIWLSHGVLARFFSTYGLSLTRAQACSRADKGALPGGQRFALGRAEVRSFGGISLCEWCRLSLGMWPFACRGEPDGLFVSGGRGRTCRWPVLRQDKFCSPFHNKRQRPPLSLQNC